MHKRQDTSTQLNSHNGDSANACHKPPSPLKNSFAAFGDTYSGCQAPVYWRFLSNAGLPIDSTTTFSTGCTVLDTPWEGWNRKACKYYCRVTNSKSPEEFEDTEQKHLELIQGVITRLAQNSFLLKGWSVTLVAAILTLASKNPNFYLAGSDASFSGRIFTSV